MRNSPGAQPIAQVRREQKEEQEAEEDERQARARDRQEKSHASNKEQEKDSICTDSGSSQICEAAGKAVLEVLGTLFLLNSASSMGLGQSERSAHKFR